MYSHFFKRIFDFIISLAGIVFLFPILLLISILLLIANSGSPFFVQPRPGKKGRIFKIIKFKTMNERRDREGNLLPDSERLTRIGKFIRKTSLDELPQLFNVLYGNMSLIGPRPLMTEYLPLYSFKQNRRHEVKPGITGWAQINGRNAISWNKKFEYDVWYVDNISINLDFKILFLTFKKVFAINEISAEGHATMPPFTLEKNQDI